MKSKPVFTKTKGVIIFFMVFHFFMDSYAQESNLTASFIENKKCDLFCTIRTSFIKNYNQINGCGRGMCFVKFNISTKGEVQNIAFNEGTPSYMQHFLQSTLLSTNGQWITEKNKGATVESKFFFLPISYVFEPCKESRDTILFMNNTIYTASPMRKIEDIPEKKNFYSFLHLIDFETTADDQIKPTFNPSYPSLECIILSPVNLVLLRGERGFEFTPRKKNNK